MTNDTNQALPVPTLQLDWQPIADHRCDLGESPFWHPGEQTLYWVDIARCQVLRANVYMGTVQVWDMPSEPGCIAPAARGGLVLALRDGIYRADAWGAALRRIATLPYDPSTVRANDGRCDASGRFWVGSVDETKTADAAALYCIDACDGNVHWTCMADGALTANGLAWSPDQRTLYWSDTPRHITMAWDFSPEGPTLRNRRVFHSFAPKPDGWQFTNSEYRGRPDGAAVDQAGNYYVAMYEGARVCKFSPSGQLIAEIPTPAQCPTMPCLGGEDGRTLFLTSARKGRDKPELTQFPLSGAVFQTRVDVAGMPVAFFRD